MLPEIPIVLLSVFRNLDSIKRAILLNYIVSPSDSKNFIKSEGGNPVIDLKTAENLLCEEKPLFSAR